ncbi:MAG TPA: TonB-dependent receptor [Longimicrobium sp.]
MKSLRTLLPALLATLAAAPLAAQTIAGKVLDRATGQPVNEATVEALRANDRVAARARSDAQGNFVIVLDDEGEYRIRARRVGYQPSTSLPVPVERRQTVQTELRISSSEVVLDPLTVTARSTPARSARLDREGFYQRERTGFGRFLTRHEIGNMVVTETSTIFRTVPGVQLVPTGGTHYALVLSRGGVTCVPRVMVDMLTIPASEIDTFVRPEHIAGIEVYRGPTEIPGRFMGQRNGCGLVVIWTEVPER